MSSKNNYLEFQFNIGLCYLYLNQPIENILNFINSIESPSNFSYQLCDFDSFYSPKTYSLTIRLLVIDNILHDISMDY